MPHPPRPQPAAHLRPSPRTLFLVGVAALLPFALPARAGDSPYLVVRGWGVGEIDNRIMFYAGPGRHIDTPIPAPPSGPRWDVVYGSLPFLLTAAIAAHLMRRRRPRPARTSRRGFDVDPAPPRAADH